MGLAEAVMLFAFLLVLAGLALLVFFFRRSSRFPDRRLQPTAGPAYKHDLARVRYHAQAPTHGSQEGAIAAQPVRPQDPRKAPLPRCPSCGVATAFSDERCAKCGGPLERPL